MLRGIGLEPGNVELLSVLPVAWWKLRGSVEAFGRAPVFEKGSTKVWRDPKGLSSCC
jgi:hypothetical protein